MRKPHKNRLCARCKQNRPDCSTSPTFMCILCDECFTDLNDEREQANIDACHSNGEQEF